MPLAAIKCITFMSRKKAGSQRNLRNALAGDIRVKNGKRDIGKSPSTSTLYLWAIRFYL
jgi:hypothetical protein